MSGIKRLINFILPVKACNLKCHYCYVGQENRFDGEMGALEYAPEHMQRALTTKRLGGTCHINMCGLGETLLAPYAVDLARRMLENGHFVSVVTNGTVRGRMDELCGLPEELRKRLFFKFSYHYLELARLQLLDAFFKNVQAVRDSGCAFSVELTVNDVSTVEIPTLKKMCEERLGAACHVIESRNNLDGYSRLAALPVEEHQRLWGEFQSPLFEFQQTQWMVKRREFCYAGDWVLNLYAESGWITPCFAGGNPIQNIFAHPEEPIHFVAIGSHCPWSHCYAAYILLSSGAIPEFETPCYAAFRDRGCPDGSHWLTPHVKEFFTSRLWQANETYSPLKQRYINALMELEYPETGRMSDSARVALGRELAEHLRENGLSSLGLWGTGEKERWLTSLLAGTSIQIKFSVDLNFYEDHPPTWKERWKHRCKYALKKLWYGTKQPVLLNRYDRFPPVRAVVVWEHGQPAPDPPELRGRTVWLTELADEAKSKRGSKH